MHLVVKCRQSLGRPDEAVAVCDDGLKIAPDDAELLYRKAVALRTLGARDEAEACWNRILTLKRPERFSSVDVGIYGHLTRRNLARIAEEKGDLRTARRLWEEILRECPEDGEILLIKATRECD